MSKSTCSFSLCADDFGLTPSISSAITDLVKRQRLSSVSCITNTKNFHVDGKQLLPYIKNIEVGLHFNLTEGAPLSPALARHWPNLPGIGHLILSTHTGLAPGVAIEEELHTQWQAFCTVFGKEPDFIDGHQHVHGLPIIRDLVLASACAQTNRPWIRNTGHLLGPGYKLKRFIITNSGGRILQRELIKKHLQHNSVLLGVYDFQLRNYRRLIQSWLSQLPSNGALIFCHPGLSISDGNETVLTQCRNSEYDYLYSDDFLQDMKLANAQLQPLSKTSLS